MDITNINNDFPPMSIGDLVDIDDPILGKHNKCLVLKTWYPKKGDEWSETEESKHLGYLSSKPTEQFPQIKIDVNGKIAIMYGTDDIYIQVIHRKTPS